LAILARRFFFTDAIENNAPRSKNQLKGLSILLPLESWIFALAEGANLPPSALANFPTFNSIFKSKSVAYE
jgi:hypothetical protein